MSYNEQLQENNADLQEILDAVNALPEAGGGVELPELTNPGTAEDLEDGKELIDAEGNIVTGTVRVAHGGIDQEADSINRIPMGDQSRIKLTVCVEEKTIVKPSAGNTISLTAPCSEFGDAEAADVAKGKTFTSAAGLKVVGTREESSGGESAETCTVTIGCNAPMMEGTFYYVDASGVFQSTAVLGRYTVQKNCLVVCTASGVTASGAERVLLAAGLSVFYVTGDCTITFS